MFIRPGVFTIHMDNPTNTQTLTAKKVEAARQAAGVSLLSLANQAGIAYTTLHRRIAGHSSFYMEELHSIAKALNVPVTSFVVTDEDAA